MKKINEMRLMAIIIVAFSGAIFSTLADSNLISFSLKTEEEDTQKIVAAKKDCENLKKFQSLDGLAIRCDDHYFLFDSNAKNNGVKATGIKIATFNFLHPGTSKTLFKDYEIVARIVNRFDVVAAQELLAISGADLAYNKSLVKFIDEGPALLAIYQKALAGASSSQIPEIKEKIKKLKTDLLIAPALYKIPGYYKILKALRALDPSWSLMISPKGDSLLLGSVEEYVGFFFRKSRVSQISNSYCALDAKNTRPLGCVVKMRQDFKLPDVSTYFSRRPMIASFKAGNFKFSFLSSHVVFNAYEDETRRDKMLQYTFGDKDLMKLGEGINEVNYARWVEISLITKWMDHYKKKFASDSLIFAGDTNLDFSNPFWATVKAAYGGDLKIEVEDKTTLSPRRFNTKEEETNGVASSYDHFIFENKDFSNCKTGKAFNYMDGETGQMVVDRYFVRDIKNLFDSGKSKRDHFDDDEENEDTGADIPLDYKLTKQNEKKMNKLLADYEALLRTELMVKNNVLASLDEAKIKDMLNAYKTRVFIKQLTNLFFYKVFQETVSDHLPAYKECAI